MLFGFVGMILGLIIFPPLGTIIGLFLGILTGELIANSDQSRALKAASGGVISSLIGILINLVLAITFLIIFVLAVF